MVRIIAALMLGLAASACSGTFFYHDVIVPSYRQVDPGTGQPAPPAPPAP